MFRLSVILLLGLTIAFAGCGGGKQASGVSAATDKKIEALPDFVKKLPTDPNLHYEWGTGASRDLSLATSKATQDAHTKMGRFLETRLQALIEGFQEEVNSAEDGEYLEMFTQTTRAIVSTVLSGIKTDRNEIINENGQYRVYVLMSMPIGAGASEFLNQIKQRQKDAYTRFRASESMQKLEAEADKFENWKKEQGGY